MTKPMIRYRVEFLGEPYRSGHKRFPALNFKSKQWALNAMELHKQRGFDSVLREEELVP